MNGSTVGKKLVRFMPIVVFSLCLPALVVAQTVGGGLACQDLGDLEGQHVSILWTHSFEAFLAAHGYELSEDQTRLLWQAIQFGRSENFSLTKAWSVNMIRGLVDSVSEAFSRDQLGEILAGMGYQAQNELVNVNAIEVHACACTTGANDGCPEGFPCTVGCFTWGTGAWNGLCTMAAVQR